MPGVEVAKAQQPAAEKPAPAVTCERSLSRSGEVEFEVESFDAAVAIVSKLVNAIPGGFVATTNSEKLANGKMRGAVVVRVPPDRLDALVLDLRKELTLKGELKNQKIGSQDVTKQYTDLESRLRAARGMEERLLQIIKSGKGEDQGPCLSRRERAGRLADQDRGIRKASYAFMLARFPSARSPSP